MKKTVSTLALALLLLNIYAQKNSTQPVNILFVIADDWSFPHASFLGDNSVKTPNIDKLSKKGIVFNNSYCATPSCTPSRASILTGRYPHQLEEGANLWGTLPVKFPNYTLILEDKGYAVGYERKGWFPAEDYTRGGYTRNPAGTRFKSFEEFLAQKSADKPFCYWFGSNDPHRGYIKGSGKKSGIDISKIKVPGGLPDTEEIRNDIADYYLEIQNLDKDFGDLITSLEKRNLLENTLIVVTSDNGMPFPRAKANLYDAGTHMPLVMYWKGKIEGGRTIIDFVSHIDFAPTFLQAAGMLIPEQMTGKSLIPLVEGKEKKGSRDMVFTERERHGNVRKGDLAYPCRSVRTNEFLLIRNLRPERMPAGDSVLYWSHGPYGDVDGSPSKNFILANRQLKVAGLKNTKNSHLTYYDLSFAVRPGMELFDLKNDPHQLNNLAYLPAYKKTAKKLNKTLMNWMKKTKDPLAFSKEDIFETYPFYGNPDGDHPDAKTFKLHMKVY